MITTLRAFKSSSSSSFFAEMKMSHFSMMHRGQKLQSEVTQEIFPHIGYTQSELEVLSRNTFILPL